MSREDNIYKNLERQIKKIAKHNRQGSYKTRERYFDAIKRFAKHIANKFGVQKFANISDKHVKSYVEHLKATNKSISMIKTDLSAIRFYHDKMSDTRHTISDNSKFDIARRTFGGVDRTWTQSQYEKMLEHTRELGQYKIAEVIEIARHQGLRIHETMRLDRSTVERAIKTEVLTIKGKNGKVRDIPLNKHTREIFRSRVETVARGEKLYVDRGRDTHLEIKRIQNFLVRHRDKISNPNENSKITYHGLRHSFAREKYDEFKNKGYSDYQARLEVSQLLGHERDEVTRIYLHKD